MMKALLIVLLLASQAFGEPGNIGQRRLYLSPKIGDGQSPLSNYRPRLVDTVRALRVPADEPFELSTSCGESYCLVALDHHNPDAIEKVSLGAVALPDSPLGGVLTAQQIADIQASPIADSVDLTWISTSTEYRAIIRYIEQSLLWFSAQRSTYHWPSEAPTTQLRSLSGAKQADVNSLLAAHKLDLAKLGKTDTDTLGSIQRDVILTRSSDDPLQMAGYDLGADRSTLGGPSIAEGTVDPVAFGPLGGVAYDDFERSSMGANWATFCSWAAFTITSGVAKTTATFVRSAELWQPSVFDRKLFVAGKLTGAQSGVPGLGWGNTSNTGCMCDQVAPTTMEMNFINGCGFTVTFSAGTSAGASDWIGFETHGGSNARCYSSPTLSNWTAYGSGDVDCTGSPNGSSDGLMMHQFEISDTTQGFTDFCGGAGTLPGGGVCTGPMRRTLRMAKTDIGRVDVVGMEKRVR